MGGAEGGVSVSSGCLFGKWIRGCRSSREGAAVREASADPARPRAPPPPAMARDYDHLFKLLIIGDSGEGRRGRRWRGPCRARPAGASGRAGGRAGGEARPAPGGRRGARRPQAPGEQPGAPGCASAGRGAQRAGCTARRWLLPHV